MEIVQINDLIPTFEHLLDRAVGETIKMEFVKDQRSLAVPDRSASTRNGNSEPGDQRS